MRTTSSDEESSETESPAKDLNRKRKSAVFGGGGGGGEVKNEIGNDEVASAEAEGFAGCGGGLIGKVKNDAVFWINRRRCLDERVRERNESL